MLHHHEMLSSGSGNQGFWNRRAPSPCPPPREGLECVGECKGASTCFSRMFGARSVYSYPASVENDNQERPSFSLRQLFRFMGPGWYDIFSSSHML